GQSGAPRRSRRGRGGGGGQKSGRPAGSGARPATGEEGSTMVEAANGNDATFAEDRVDDDTIELKAQGDNLGLLIGPKGQTLQAVQELARTVVQRQASGTHHGRVRIDVAGYRQRRREALERFTQQVAADVVSSG